MATKETPQPETHPPQKQEHFFSVFSIFFGIALLIVAGVLYWNVYPLPSFVSILLLALSGLLILKLSFETGFEHRRKAILKRYL